jgi:hypothetical protein
METVVIPRELDRIRALKVLQDDILKTAKADEHPSIIAAFTIAGELLDHIAGIRNALERIASHASSPEKS